MGTGREDLDTLSCRAHRALPDLAGAALRLYHIDANGFNTRTRSWAVWLTGHGFSFVVRTTAPGGADPSTPPLYYMLMWFFTQLGQQPLWVRMVSVLAGTVMVWLTFRLAMDLFDDLRIATLSALLVAVAPLLITWSRVARAYTLSSLWVFTSLYFFALLLFKSKGAGKWTWLGLMLVTAAAVWTHYLNVLVILFENLCRGIPLAAGARFQGAAHPVVRKPGPGGDHDSAGVARCVQRCAFTTANEWWTRPDLQALVKSVILFNTGDPSYGPTGFTPARLLSLLAIMGIWALALWGVHWTRLSSPARRRRAAHSVPGWRRAGTIDDVPGDLDGAPTVRRKVLSLYCASPVHCARLGRHARSARDRRGAAPADVRRRTRVVLVRVLLGAFRRAVARGNLFCSFKSSI